MVKLTKARLRFLERLKGGAITAMDLQPLALKMAQQMSADGLVDRFFRGFGQWAYRLTDAGRAALSPNSEEAGRHG